MVLLRHARSLIQSAQYECAVSAAGGAWYGCLVVPIIAQCPLVPAAHCQLPGVNGILCLAAVPAVAWYFPVAPAAHWQHGNDA